MFQVENKIADLNSIKSKYILLQIISFLIEREKLEIFKYNKQLQNKLNINIYDYKRFSRKYKVEGINGKGKEYYDNCKLAFEGGIYKR